MKIFTTKGFFSGLPSKDPNAHIIKLRLACKSCVESPNLDVYIIGLTVFPISLTGEASISFTKFPYNSIYTLEQIKDVFLARYYKFLKSITTLIG